MKEFVVGQAGKGTLLRSYIAESATLAKRPKAQLYVLEAVASVAIMGLIQGQHGSGSIIRCLFKEFDCL